MLTRACRLFDNLLRMVQTHPKFCESDKLALTKHDTGYHDRIGISDLPNLPICA
jgi:hypothetical protein